MFDGGIGLGEDEANDEDDEVLPARASVPPRSSKQRTRVNLSKRDVVLMSEVRSLFNGSFVLFLLTYYEH